MEVIYVLQSLKYVPSGPFQKKCADPWLTTDLRGEGLLFCHVLSVVHRTQMRTPRHRSDSQAMLRPTPPPESHLNSVPCSVDVFLILWQWQIAINVSCSWFLCLSLSRPVTNNSSSGTGLWTTLWAVGAGCPVDTRVGVRTAYFQHWEAFPVLCAHSAYAGVGTCVGKPLLE